MNEHLEAEIAEYYEARRKTLKKGLAALTKEIKAKTKSLQDYVDELDILL